jgi:hypothetical protein
MTRKWKLLIRETRVHEGVNEAQLINCTKDDIKTRYQAPWLMTSISKYGGDVLYCGIIERVAMVDRYRPIESCGTHHAVEPLHRRSCM